MKKLISYVLFLLLISSFPIGCGKTSQPAEKTPTPSTQNANNDTSPSEETPASMDSLGALLSTTYADMMKNDKYLMRYKMTSEFDGESLEVEGIVGVSGDNVAVTSIAAGTKTTIISLGETTYMVNHSEKTVLEIPPGNAMNGDEMEDNLIETDGLTYESSGIEDGLTYEKYSTTDGAMKYYFEGKKLVKIVLEMDEEPLVMNILEMSDTVPNSMFEVPSNYEKTTLPG